MSVCLLQPSLEHTNMGTMATRITAYMCRFCLSQNDHTKSVFIRFDAETISEHLSGLLGLYLDSSDEYTNICETCASKVEIMLSIIFEFRKTNKIFCSLLQQQRNRLQKQTKCVSGIDIKILGQNEPEGIIRKSPIVDKRLITKEETATPRISNPRSIKYEAEGLLEDETIEEEPYVDELHDVPEKAIQETQQKPDQKELCCYVCNTFSGSCEACSNHLQTTHSRLLPYRCDQCAMVLEDVHCMNDHFRSHQTPLGCLYCKKMFKTKSELDEHQSGCIGYRCKGCGKSFKYVSQLKEHNLCTYSKIQRLRMVNRLISSFGENEPKGSLYCAVCDEKFIQNPSLAGHFEREHPTASITLHRCDLCALKFTSLTDARQHRISHEKDRSPKNDKANQCTICLENFKFNRELSQHFETGHKEISVKLHQCTKCKRKFTSEAKLRKHDYNTHQGRQPRFFCSFCGRVFNKRIGLQDHENIHKGVKEYWCSECTRHFAYKSSYDRHMQVVHNDSKKFTCEYCQKSFKRKPTLKVHLRLHTGEKPYQCEFCSQKFVDPSSFHRHKQKQHPRAT